MYQKPALQRFGDLRALTLVGTDADGDGGITLNVFGNTVTVGDGCNVTEALGGSCRS